MAELYDEGKELAEMLMRKGLSDEQITMIMLLLETQEEKKTVYEWLKNNMQATQGEILEYAILSMEDAEA